MPSRTIDAPSSFDKKTVLMVVRQHGNEDGSSYVVEVAGNGEMLSAEAAPAAVAAAGERTSAVANGEGDAVRAALAGNIFKVLVRPGDTVAEGQVVIVLEAMKMETDVSAPRAGTVAAVHVAEGDAVTVGQPLFDLS